MVYLGSKRRIAKDILPIILKDRSEDQYYVEPFAGGMNSLCKVPGKRIANDINFYLIEMWKAFLSGWIPEIISKELYDNIRVNKSSHPPHIVGWAGFGCSYSGKWFGGFVGEMSSTEGKIRYRQEETKRNILAQLEYMQDVVFSSCNYSELNIPDNSIIYCDPPYRGTTGYNSKIDHDKFWQWCRDQTYKGHQVFVSEYEAP
jgi:DNA adenine methylase